MKIMKLSQTKLMGIVNITPDSFSDGGKYIQATQAMAHIETLIQEGADIIDIGAESSRPGATPLTAEEEIARLKPILIQYKAHFSTPLSIDTTKAEVASFALDLGADMINDISGFRADPTLPKVISQYKATAILMHMQGNPETMQHAPHYDSVIDTVKKSLSESIEIAKAAGIKDIIIDPGIGFGKTVDHNLELLQQLEQFKSLGYPILIGTSRKSFIGAITGESVENRLEGSLASGLFAVIKGASILRVHDVKPHKKALNMLDALLGTR